MSRRIHSIGFLPDRNQRARDYTGAFLPSARAWARHPMHAHHPPHHAASAQLVQIDPTSSPAAMRAATLRAIDGLGALAVGADDLRLAWFCHGFTRRIGLGWDIAGTRELAKAARALVASDATAPTITISLYACSTGDGPGPGGDRGFADQLRDALCVEGLTSCVVLAHDTAGHAARNSRKRRFGGDGSPIGGVGGSWWVAPGAPLWRAWRDAMRTGDLWIRCPYMTPAEVHRELIGGRS